MIPTEIRDSVRILEAQGRTLREISRLLKLSRNTVRRILRDGEAAAAPPCEPQTLARLEDAFARARGNVARVQQLLVEENDQQVAYSTLTRWIREAGLRRPPQRDPSLERYAAALKQRTHGRGPRALRRLLEMKRTYPAAPFLAAIEQALQFGLFDLARLETLILRQVAGDFFNLDGATDDDA